MSIHVQERWLSLIIDGVKTIEGRKFKEEYMRMSGKIVELTDGNRVVKAMIEDAIHYDSIQSYLNTEGFDQVLPGISSYEEAVKTYREFQSKDPVVADEIIRNAGGMVALKLKVI